MLEQNMLPTLILQLHSTKSLKHSTKSLTITILNVFMNPRLIVMLSFNVHVCSIAFYVYRRQMYSTLAINFKGTHTYKKLR